MRWPIPVALSAACATPAPLAEPSESAVPSTTVTETECDAHQRWRDDDGDGYGGAEAIVCRDVPGFAEAPGDCDDSRSDVNPGAVESCSDEVDDDCDGLTACTLGWYQPTVVRVADLNEDGWTDLLIGSPFAGTYTPDGTFGACLGPHTVDGCVGWSGYAAIRSEQRAGEAFAVVGDLDGDGVHEVAVGWPGTWYDLYYDPSVYLMSGATGDELGWLLSPAQSWKGGSLSSADVTGDAEIELVVPELFAQGPSKVWVLSPRAEQARFELAGWAVESSGHDLTVVADGDVGGDGIADVVIADTVSGLVSLLSGPLTPGIHFDDGVLMTGRPGLGDQLASAGDTDGDGLGDLVATPSADRSFIPIAVFRGTATHSGDLFDSVSATVQVDRGTEFRCGAGDLDGDGFADLAFHHDAWGVGLVGVHYGPDFDRLSSRYVRGAPVTSCDRGGDLDGDGTPDLAVALGNDVGWFGGALFQR